MSQPQPNGCLASFVVVFLAFVVYFVFSSCMPKQEDDLYSVWRCWKSLDGQWETLDYGYPRAKPGGKDSECEPVR